MESFKNWFNNFNSRQRLALLIVVALSLLIVGILITTCTNGKIAAINSQRELLENDLDALERESFNNEQKIKGLQKSDNFETDLENSEYAQIVKELKGNNEQEHHIDIGEFFYQNPELPCGCEAVALTNQLKYYGFSPSKTEICDKYLTYSNEDFVNSFVGDPYSELDGVTVLAPGLSAAANRYLTANKADMFAYNVSDRNFEDLFAYIEKGHPVQIWATMYMEQPGEIKGGCQGYNFHINEHSLLLTGFNRENNTVDVCCSLAGKVSYSKSQVEEVWKTIGKQAVVIVKDSEVEQWKGGNDDQGD